MVGPPPRETVKGVTEPGLSAHCLISAAASAKRQPPFFNYELKIVNYELSKRSLVL
jgi:hypothetical protein